MSAAEGASPMNLEFAPANTVPWLIGNFRFDSELEFHVFGVRGGRIPDREIEVEWLRVE